MLCTQQGVQVSRATCDVPYCKTGLELEQGHGHQPSTVQDVRFVRPKLRSDKRYPNNAEASMHDGDEHEAMRALGHETTRTQGRVSSRLNSLGASASLASESLKPRRSQSAGVSGSRLQLISTRDGHKSTCENLRVPNVEHYVAST
eukprot:gene28190-31283_t